MEHAPPRKETLHGYYQCMRLCMFIVNLLFTIGATVTSGYASYLAITRWDLLSKHSTNITPIAMFILFALIIIVCIIGSIAAYKISRSLLLTYAFFLSLCFIVQIVIICLIASYINTDEFLHDRWNELSTNDQIWIQNKLKCCGFNENYPDETCTQSQYTTYCESALKSYLKKINIVLLISNVALSVFEIGGVVVSFILIRGLKAQIERIKTSSFIEYSRIEDDPTYHPIKMDAL